MTARARVLLVEDDPSLQRFVVLALSELPLDVRCCASVDAALELLREQDVHLILTDLMLPGRSGFELIEALAQAPALQAEAKIIVFSAGLSPAARQRLEGHRVWRLLSKPCTVSTLESCVRDALFSEPAPRASPDRPEPSASADHTEAVARHFGGNRALYDSYRAGCLRQFALDIDVGDQACLQQEAEVLHRLAHNLKSVLLILGHDAASGLAGQLEARASSSDWAASLSIWQALRDQVRRLA